MLGPGEVEGTRQASAGNSDCYCSRRGRKWEGTVVLAEDWLLWGLESLQGNKRSTGNLSMKQGSGTVQQGRKKKAGDEEVRNKGLWDGCERTVHAYAL